MNRYIDLLDNEDVYIKLEVTPVGMFLHCDVYGKYTPSLRKFLYDFKEDLLVTLGLFDVPCLFTRIPEGDKKVKKFNESMGFEEVHKEGGTIYMVQDV